MFNAVTRSACLNQSTFDAQMITHVRRTQVLDLNLADDWPALYCLERRQRDAGIRQELPPRVLEVRDIDGMIDVSKAV